MAIIYVRQHNKTHQTGYKQANNSRRVQMIEQSLYTWVACLMPYKPLHKKHSRWDTDDSKAGLMLHKNIVLSCECSQPPRAGDFNLMWTKRREPRLVELCGKSDSFIWIGSFERLVLLNRYFQFNDQNCSYFRNWAGIARYVKYFAGTLTFVFVVVYFMSYIFDIASMVIFEIN